MTSQAINFEGTDVKIGAGNAVTVAAADDTFTEIKEVKSTDGPGGSTTIIDVTHAKSTAKEKRAGTKDEGQFSITANYLPEDPGHVAAQTARTARALRNIKVTLVSGAVLDFKAFCVEYKQTAGVDSAFDASIVLEISGDVALTPAT